ncbi:hypothetical protein Rs2_14528 [Raphanus sativus]|nr:hypothetical protein Rs2_14528 [Raphanus sativus]
MANPWFPSNSASALSPSLLTPGDSRLLAPPDPPDLDPNNPLSLARFPPLNSPNPVLPSNPNPKINPSLPSDPASTPSLNPSIVSNHALNPAPASLNPYSSTSLPSSAPSIAEKIRKSVDKSLRRRAPISSSESGRPRVFIPESVFQKGAELHKDFIICYFNGRPPPFKHIQNVLNSLWGKGSRVEIHSNPLSRSMLVRIPSDYLRLKILEKRVWYIGDSMFQAVQWTSTASSSSPPLQSIQIWAHLQGIPLDLRHEEGLSLIAGLVGEPKETDDFTLNLVSLTMSHVKVAVDLTHPLPTVVEFTRQSGDVVEVAVSYPWVPPTCSHCKELGHIMKNCLLLPPPEKQNTQKQKGKAPASSATPSKNQSTPKPKEKDSVNLASSSAAPSPAPPPVPPLNPLPSQKPLPFKRPRPSSSQSYPSFTAQLNSFSTPQLLFGPLPLPALPPPPSSSFDSNPFAILATHGPLPREEVID